MKYHVLTLFPEHLDQGLNSSILKKAREKDLIQLNLVNIRDFSGNKHMTVDDYPYGGGAGMVMQPGPIINAYRHVVKEHSVKRVIYMSPQGRPLTQAIAEELAKEDELMFICGHYEGVDERVIESIVTEELSIGDYVLTGGELAAMVVIDAVSRHVPGVLSNHVSMDVESFDDGLLEYPQYTRPLEFEGMKVPDILLSGHHANIETYRRQQSLLRTAQKRPDLLKKAALTKDDIDYLTNTCNISKDML